MKSYQKRIFGRMNIKVVLFFVLRTAKNHNIKFVNDCVTVISEVNIHMYSSICIIHYVCQKDPHGGHSTYGLRSLLRQSALIPTTNQPLCLYFCYKYVNLKYLKLIVSKIFSKQRCFTNTVYCIVVLPRCLHCSALNISIYYNLHVSCTWNFFLRS